MPVFTGAKLKHYILAAVNHWLIDVLQLVGGRELSIETRLSVTGAELKRHILTAVNHWLIDVLQLVGGRELSIETQLSVTGAELKRHILAAVNQNDLVNIKNIKLITSGRVIDDDVSLQQQQLIRVCNVYYWLL